jgi:hypothetical protein
LKPSALEKSKCVQQHESRRIRLTKRGAKVSAFIFSRYKKNEEAALIAVPSFVVWPRED